MEGIPKNNNEKINELHSAHLINPELAIMTCVGTQNQHKLDNGKLSKDLQYLIGTSEKINFHASADELERNNIENSGEQTFVISQLNENSKWSGNFYNCTGVIAVGRDAETGKNISFITHQDPTHFLTELTKEFNKIFTERLQELKNRCDTGTLDVVIAGGNYLMQGRKKEDFQSNYEESIKLLNTLVLDNLGFNPIIASGPKVQNGKDNLVFDNDNRRLYISRDYFTQYKKVNEAYHPDDFDDEKEKWGKRNR